MGYSAFTLVQAAVGCVPRGESTNTRAIENVTEVIPPQVCLYRKEMKCIREGGIVHLPGKGTPAIQLTRTELPGEICVGCGGAYHCILLNIAESDTNRNLLPENFRDLVIV